LKKYYARWFNDQDGRLERAAEAGYEYVTPDEVAGVGDREVHSGNTDLNSMVSRVVGRTDNNHPIRAFLMKIRRDWYEEDQQEKQQQNDLVDEAIRAGRAGGADIGNKYGEVKLS